MKVQLCDWCDDVADVEIVCQHVHSSFVCSAHEHDELRSLAKHAVHVADLVERPEFRVIARLNDNNRRSYR